jgi:hypothetical protein
MTHLKIYALNIGQLRDLILSKFVENECGEPRLQFNPRGKTNSQANQMTHLKLNTLNTG